MHVWNERLLRVLSRFFSPTSKCSVCRNPPEVSSCLQLQPDFGYYNPDPSLCYPDTVRTQKAVAKVT